MSPKPTLTLKVFRPTHLGLFALSLFVFHTPSGAQDLPVTTLSPAGLFKIPVNEPELVKGVQTNQSGIWFLLDGGTFSEAVQVNDDGALQKRILLMTDPANQIRGFCVSAGGEIAVVHKDCRIERYADSGSLASSTKLSDYALGCAFSGHTLLSVSSSEVDAIDASSTHVVARGRQALLWPNIVLALPNHRIGIIEMGEGALNEVDSVGAAWERHLLIAPEVQGVTREQRSDSTVYPSVFAADVNSSGDIFVAISPYVVSQGAIVLQFGLDGSLKARMRCVLPKSPDLVTDRIKDGRFAVTYLAVKNHRLFLISRSQKRAVYYGLR